ncbi:MAG TPA: hypothetical protein VLL48_08420, partial [Longimicrobiales bacterium]|nr:hypothetical protein [Longimicrobiales bacterium]
FQYGGRISFRNNVTFFATGILSGFDFPADAYEDLFVDLGGGERRPFLPDQEGFQPLHGLRLFTWFNTWERFRGRIRAEWRQTPVFEQEVGVPVETAEAWIVDGSFNVFPTRQLQSEIGIRHESLFLHDGGGRYSTATIPRIRTQYQFTRALFLRTIVEYNSQDRTPLTEPSSGLPILQCEDACERSEGTVDHDVYGEVLLSYEPSPGTVFFLGYSRTMVDDGAFAFRRMSRQSDGLFLKGSYRFRF